MMKRETVQLLWFLWLMATIAVTYMWLSSFVRSETVKAVATTLVVSFTFALGGLTLSGDYE